MTPTTTSHTLKAQQRQLKSLYIDYYHFLSLLNMTSYSKTFVRAIQYDIPIFEFLAIGIVVLVH